MKKEVHRWYSHRVGRQMNMAVYGSYGFPLLMFPTAAADFEEYERFHLLDKVRHLVDAGRVKVFSIDTVNRKTWMDKKATPGRRAYLHEFYDQYVTEEVVPFIWNHQRARQAARLAGAVAVAAGLMYSPHTFTRGKALASISVTLKPALARWNAATLPAGPAPMMTTRVVTRHPTPRASPPQA